MIGPIILQVVLIFLNAIFASAEIAVISMNDTRLRKLTADGDTRAIKLTALTEQPSRFLATIQVAITLAGLLGSAYAAENFAEPLVATLVSLGITIPAHILKSASVFFITLILAYFSLVFGELVPKRIAMKKAERMALGMSGMLYFVAKIFSPVVWLLTISTNGILRLMGINPEEQEEAVTEEEIRMLLLEGNEKGTIHAEENQMIQNVFEFNDIAVEQICTHRKDVAALSMEDSEEEWEQIIRNKRHAFYLVCGESQDDIIGVLDTGDYFRTEDKSRQHIMETAVDKAFFIPEGIRANVLFQNMKKNRTYFAVIIDEYGGLSGIITLHDLMEALVGDLEEADEPERPKDIERKGEGLWKIQGCADLEEVAKTIKRPLPTSTYDTFSGFICGTIGRVPKDGESFVCEAHGLEIRVHEVMHHRIGETTVVEKQAL